MSIQIFKYVEYVPRDITGVGVTHRTGTSATIDLSGFYTKIDLQTPGLAQVDFANIMNAYHNEMLGLQGGLEYSDSAPPDSDDSSDISDVIHEYYHLSAYDYNRVLAGAFFWEVDSVGMVSLKNEYRDLEYLDLLGPYIYSNISLGGSLWILQAPLLTDLEGVSFQIIAGSSSNSSGGGVSIYGGDGGTWGNGVNIGAGSGPNGGGTIGITAGYSETGQAGNIWITAGQTVSGTPGNIYLVSGYTYDSDLLPYGNIYLGAVGDGPGGILPLAGEADNYVVHYDPITGKLSYDVAGGLGLTPTDNILEWDAGNNYYRPYLINSGGLQYTYKDIYGGLYNWYTYPYEIYFDDWYLPSQWEMEQLMAVSDLPVTPGIYWTSTEYDADNAVTVDDEGTVSYDDKSVSHNIWPVRRFQEVFTFIFGGFGIGYTGPSGGLIFYIDVEDLSRTYWECRYVELPGGGTWSNITDQMVPIRTLSILGNYNCLYIIGQNGHTESAASMAMGAISRREGYTSSSLSPSGWHIPNMQEIITLVNYAGSGNSVIAARALAQPGDYWDDDTYANNSTGFSAIGSGRRSGDDGTFIDQATDFWMWSADYPEGWGLQIVNEGGDFDLYYGVLELGYSHDGHSIRMLQDNLKDIDGNEYHTVVINGLEWTVENLKTSRYSFGEQIPLITDNTEWENDTVGARADYDNDGYSPDFGYLYNGYAVDNGLIYFTRGGTQETGWRLPTQTEWKDMCASVEESGGLVPSLKDTSGWYVNGGSDGTNTTLFTAIAGGVRSRAGFFYDAGYYFQIYTSSQRTGAYITGWIYYDHTWGVSDGGESDSDGFYVRAVRPASTVTMTDNDGNTYSTVKIGTQCWTTSNLKTESYRNDTPVPYISGNNEWMADAYGAMSYWNNEQDSGGSSGELIFYTGTTNPEGTTRLNLNGILWVTDLYVGGEHYNPGGGDSLWEVDGSSNLKPINEYDQIWLDSTVALVSSGRVSKTIHIPLMDLYFSDQGPSPTTKGNGNFFVLSYETSEESTFILEFPGDYEAGTDIKIKIYWAIDEALDSTEQAVYWRTRHNFRAVGDDMEEWCEVVFGGDDSGFIEIPNDTNTMVLTELRIWADDIAISGVQGGDLMFVFISRESVSNGNTNPIQNPYVLSVDLEYNVSRLGGAHFENMTPDVESYIP